MANENYSLDLLQAAKFLCMSPSSLREKAKSGRIPGAKPGKRWVFLRKDLEAYLRPLYSGTGQAPLSGSDTGVLVTLQTRQHLVGPLHVTQRRKNTPICWDYRQETGPGIPRPAKS